MHDIETELHDPELMASCSENIRQAILILPEFYNVCNSCAFVGGVAVTLLASWDGSSKDKTFEEYYETYLDKIKAECEQGYAAMIAMNKQTHETNGTPQ